MKKEASGPLDRARASHVETTNKIGRLEAERNDALLRDDDKTAARLDAELEDLRRLSRAQRDKIGLLEAKAEREAAEARVKEKLGLIERIEWKLTERDAAAAELQAAIEGADKAFRKMINLARDVRAAWPWAAHDLPPMLIGEAAIVAAVKHELFRVGARPALGGGQDKPGSTISFPGGVAPRIELVGSPGSVAPLGEIARGSTALASQIMRTGKSTGVITAPAGNEPTPRQRTAAEEKLASLHKRQSELAADPASSDQEYEQVVNEIVVAAAAVDAEKRGAQA